jgi:ankyrin repeat protein
MHFASFFGNYGLIQYLIEEGGDAFATNAQEINMLHVGAQGDQPISIALFLSLGLDINSRDKRLSTPLHWAAFAGADLALQYIVA